MHSRLLPQLPSEQLLQMELQGYAVLVRTVQLS